MQRACRLAAVESTYGCGRGVFEAISRDATPIADYSARFSSVAARVDVDLPLYERAGVVVSAPQAGPGNWAGGASCVLVDGIFWLAYRIRRPLHAGRGGRRGR